jgi:hypothetical protein
LTGRQTKGQILIIIVLVLIGIIVIFALASRSSVRVRATPLVREAYWTIDNSPVTTARVGDHVEAHVVIEAVEEYVGSVTFKVRKDISIWPDSDYHISTVPVSLRGGDEHEIEIAYIPDQGSGGGLRGLRGYFIEVDFQATGTTWVMENSYPPRLSVSSLD